MPSYSNPKSDEQIINRLDGIGIYEVGEIELF